MAKKPARGTWRFLQQGSSLRLLTPEGWQLLPGEELDRDSASEAAGRYRVLRRAYLYPVEELGDDPVRLREELAKVRPAGPLFGNTARIFSDGEHRILVIEWHH